MKSHLQEGIDSVLLTSAAPAERGRRRGAAPAGNCPWNSCWEQLIVLGIPAGKTPPQPPEQPLVGLELLIPSRGSRAARRGQGSSLHGQQDRRTLCQSQHPKIQASGSAQQLHSGIGSARAPLELRFCPKRPQKVAPPPRAGPGSSKPSPGSSQGSTYLGKVGEPHPSPAPAGNPQFFTRKTRKKLCFAFPWGWEQGKGRRRESLAGNVD